MSLDGIPEGLSRETTIRRDAEGRWFHDDEEITNPAIQRAFDRWVCRAEDGRLCLKNEVNWAYVEIEGAPIFVRRVSDEGGRPCLHLSDETAEPVDPASLRQDARGLLYCDVRQGSLTAQFTRRAMMELEPWVGEDAHGTYLRVGEGRIRPPAVDDPISAHSREIENPDR